LLQSTFCKALKVFSSAGKKKEILNHGREMQMSIARRLYTWRVKNELKNYVHKQPHATALTLSLLLH